MKTLLETIADADEVEIDTLWAILKYQEIGILRKLKCMSLVLGLEEDEVIQSAPADSNGRILDHETRKQIHEVLLAVSQKSKQ